MNDAWVNDTYRSREQRTALVAFAEAIGARKRLGEDEAGNPRIDGAHGRVYVMPKSVDPGARPKYQIYVWGSAQRWRPAKEALGAFAKVTNGVDYGADEGILVMDRLPTPAEGEVIRDKCGIGKKRYVSEETRERLRRMAFQPRTGSEQQEG
jgi:hypothetical protein